MYVYTHWNARSAVYDIAHILYLSNKYRCQIQHFIIYVSFTIRSYQIALNIIFMFKSIFLKGAKLSRDRMVLAVNTRTVLAHIVPQQGCEAILIEILQLKRSAAGPHFTCFSRK